MYQTFVNNACNDSIYESKTLPLLETNKRNCKSKMKNKIDLSRIPHWMFWPSLEFRYCTCTCTWCIMHTHYSQPFPSSSVELQLFVLILCGNPFWRFNGFKYKFYVVFVAGQYIESANCSHQLPFFKLFWQEEVSYDIYKW